MLPPAEVDGVWVFSPLRREGREWGTAVLRRVDGDRRRIYTARYVLAIKGKERGQVRGVGPGGRERAGRRARAAAAGRAASASTTSSRRCRCRRRPGSPRGRARWRTSLAAEAAALLERFRRHLRDHRLPVTRSATSSPRSSSCREEHLSVDAIRRALKERGERVGTATVYRTLDMLVESGLVRAHDFGEGFKRYEPMSAQAHHEHLICLRCGRVVEFQNERLERMLPIIADEHAFQHRATGWRSTACAANAAGVSSGRADERARGTGHRGGVRRRAAQLPLALRAAAGAVLRRLPHRDDAA